MGRGRGGGVGVRYAGGMRIRLDIAYDGTGFKGWAVQPGLRTVQGVLQDALERVVGRGSAGHNGGGLAGHGGKSAASGEGSADSGEGSAGLRGGSAGLGEGSAGPAGSADGGGGSAGVRLVVAGRTDAGVHASGQVAHLDLDESQLERINQRRASAGEDRIEALARRIRGVLGAYSDVDVMATSAAPEGFDARFSAVWRRYEYRLADTVSGYHPLTRAFTTFHKAALDLDAMNDAASRLIGLHDFAAYCKPRDEATTIRTLLEFAWRRDDAGVLVAHLKADAFCHSMVRALVGACTAVGEGRLQPSDVETLRDAGERTSAFKVLAARGLTLAEVGYPADELLAERAEQTRARRELD